MSSFDTIEGHMNQLLQIWHFIISPAGNLVTFAAGLGWLGFVVFREPDSEVTPNAVVGTKITAPCGSALIWQGKRR